MNVCSRILDKLRRAHWINYLVSVIHSALKANVYHKQYFLLRIDDALFRLWATHFPTGEDIA